MNLFVFFYLDCDSWHTSTCKTNGLCSGYCALTFIFLKNIKPTVEKLNFKCSILELCTKDSHFKYQRTLFGLNLSLILKAG